MLIKPVFLKLSRKSTTTKVLFPNIFQKITSLLVRAVPDAVSRPVVPGNVRHH